MRVNARSALVYEDISTGEVHYNSAINAATGTYLTTAVQGTEYKNYVVRVKKETTTTTDADGDTEKAQYSLQFAYSGKYFQDLTGFAANDIISTSSDKGYYYITKESGNNSYFNIQSVGNSSGSSGSTDGLFLDARGSQTNVCGWVDSNGGGSCKSYQFFPVEILSDFFTLTYDIHNGQATYTKVVAVGSSYPELSSLLTSDGWTLSYTDAEGAPSGTVTADKTLHIDFTAGDTNLPFSISDAVDNEDTKWMYLKTRNDTKYIYTTTSTTDVTMNTTWKVGSDFFGYNGLQSSDHLRDAVSWCITGNPITGFYLFNKLTQEYLYGSSTSSSGTKISQTTSANAATPFDLIRNNSNWYIRFHGSATNYLSDWENYSPNQLRTWDSSSNIGDAGSIIIFRDVSSDLTVTTDNLLTPTLPGTGVKRSVGYYDVWKTQDFSAFNSLTNDELYNALAALAADTVRLDTGVYYKLCASRTDKAYSDAQYRWISGASILCNQDGSLNTADANRIIYRVTATDAEVPMLWKLESATADDVSGYKIRNVNNGCVWGQNKEAKVAIPVISSDVESGGWYGLYNFRKTGSSLGEWYIDCDNSSATELSVKRVNAHGGLSDGDYKICGYSGNDGTDPGFRWYLIPVSSVTLKVYNDLHWASVCYPFAVTLPEELTPYIAKTAGEEAILLTEIDRTVPANTPIVVTSGESSTEDFEVTIAYDNTTDAPANAFSGATASRSSFDEGTFYALAAGDGIPVFRLNGSSITAVPANKAYLPHDNSSANNALRLSFGEVTGLDAVAAPVKDADKVYYDLQGRRILYPTHGVYVTAAGEKVFIQ